VTALVREPVNIALDGVKIMRGNVLEGLSGQDAVVYEIGVKSTGPYDRGYSRDIRYGAVHSAEIGVGDGHGDRIQPAGGNDIAGKRDTRRRIDDGLEIPEKFPAICAAVKTALMGSMKKVLFLRIGPEEIPPNRFASGYSWAAERGESNRGHPGRC
jgi:hypothetical protein